MDALGHLPGQAARAAHLHEDSGRLRQAARLLTGRGSPYALRLLELADALKAGHLPLPASPPSGNHPPFNGRVVMALHGSPPYLSNGYAVRTHRLIEALRRRDIQVHALTRPNFPQDLKAFRNVDAAPADIAGGLTWHRCTATAPLWEGPLSAYVDAFADHLAEAAQRTGASVIHAASNHVCGLAAALAARRAGTACVYEVRGLWHWSTILRRPGWEETDTFALHEHLEAQAARMADRIVVLGQPLADHVTAWGIPRHRIHLSPNGVDGSAFAPGPGDTALRHRLGAEDDTFLVGFIGTFAPYEGLERLVDAVTAINRRGVPLRLALIGNGEAEAGIRRRLTHEQIPVALHPRVPMDDVPSVLRSLDAAVFARHGEGPARIVPPLKLAEAMACGLPVLVTDLPPLTEPLDDGVCGLICPDSLTGVTEGLQRLGRMSREDRAAMGAAARRAVEPRTWEAAADALVHAWETPS